MNFILSLLGGASVQIYIYLALVFGSFGAGFYVEHIRFVNFQDEVRIVAEKQIQENKDKLKEQELINKGVSDAYQARINSIHLMYGGMHNASSSPVSSVPNATITVNGETHNILSVAEECSITTTQLITLQDWVNQQIGIK